MYEKADEWAKLAARNFALVGWNRCGSQIDTTHVQCPYLSLLHTRIVRFQERSELKPSVELKAG